MPVPTMSQSVEGVSYLAAFGGGLVSFASPCVLPIVPAYLSVVTGLDVAEVRSGPRHHLGRITRDTTLFVAGFSAVFILLGLSATAVGQVLFRNHVLLTRLSGVAVLVMAAFLVGSLVLSSRAGRPARLRAWWMYAEARFHPSPSRFGPFAAPVAGAAFGFGWTPCIGPILASVLAIAATQGRALQGAALLACYSLGLGVPFLATGLALGRLAGAFDWVRRHFTVLTFSSAVVLAGFGVLLALDRLTWVTTQLQSALEAVGLGRLVSLG
ncbi:MAG: cytochrome c biogenesis protein CcdA [Actinobacteria bacterium]|nr:MAG: cytochrome c biogenesis protein CcdA [Actinomycetota bacterium]